MEASALLDAHVQLKRIYTALNEALDLTRQLAEAVDRDDEVTVQMVLAMRQEPIERIARAYEALEEQRLSLNGDDAARLSELINGEAERTPEEARLAKQAGLNQRVLRQIVDLDKVVNRKLARDKSIYN